MRRRISRLAARSRGLLAPIIMSFCVTGTFTASGNPWDVWIMVTFGFIGYLAQKYHFAPAGILLGIILGPIAEQGLRNTVVIARGDFLGFLAGRPISLLIIAMIVAAICFALKTKAWEKLEQAESEAEQRRTDPAE